MNITVSTAHVVEKTPPPKFPGAWCVFWPTLTCGTTVWMYKLYVNDPSSGGEQRAIAEADAKQRPGSMLVYVPADGEWSAAGLPACVSSLLRASRSTVEFLRDIGHAERADKLNGLVDCVVGHYSGGGN